MEIYFDLIISLQGSLDFIESVVRLYDVGRTRDVEEDQEDGEEDGEEDEDQDGFSDDIPDDNDDDDEDCKFCMKYCMFNEVLFILNSVSLYQNWQEFSYFRLFFS